ncbi:MAG: cupin domain-containing protein [Kineosporiaceae bacterium]|jgi:mannose-6-phosphate isomerase-like protein (cupin superfamily)
MSLPGSYPPVSYDGESGEASAWLRSHDASHDVRHANGGGAVYLASSTATKGAFGLYRWDMGPTPSGPGPHFHRTITESFYVLSGSVRLYDGIRWLDAGPGDFLHVPVGGIHGFRNESGEPASMLLLFTPGAPREEYFETLADGARRDAMTDEERADFFARHDNVWL